MVWLQDSIQSISTIIPFPYPFHVEKGHVFPFNMFNSSRWRVDIVLTKDNIHTLVNVVITDPTQANLFPRFCTTKGFVAFDAAQTKKWNYHN